MIFRDICVFRGVVLCFLEQRVRNGRVKVADVKTYHCVAALVFDSIEPIDYVVRVLPLVCVCFGSYVANDLLYYLFADFAQFWFTWVD